MVTRIETGRRKRIVFLVSFFAAGLLLIIVSTDVADGEWTGEVSVSPERAYIGGPFTCSVQFLNTGSTEITIQSIVFTIKWPSPPPFPDWPDPTEHHLIFKGNQTIMPGESFTFERTITSGLYGGFSTETSIVARSEWDGSVSENKFPDTISLGGESPGYVDPYLIFLLLMTFAFVIAFIIRYHPWTDEKARLNLSDTEIRWFSENLHRLARLRHDELITRYWYAGLREVTTNTQSPIDMVRPGVLVATDQRLLFFSKTIDADAYRSGFGIPTAKSEIICKWKETELDEIRSYQVSVGSGGTSKLVVFYWNRGMVEMVEYWYLNDLDSNSLQIKGKTASEELRRFMESLIDTRLAKLKEESAYAEKKRLVDFSTLREKMEKEGIDMKTFRCPSCGGDIAIPPSGMSVKCQYCGSMIFVKELLEE